jgi:hypothetical protein
MLLETKVSRDDGYQKQQGMHREPRGRNNADSAIRYADSLDGSEHHGHGLEFSRVRRVHGNMVSANIGTLERC